MITSRIERPRLRRETTARRSKHSSYSVWSDSAQLPTTFEELRYMTLVVDELERIYWRIRPLGVLLDWFNIEWSIAMPAKPGYKSNGDWRFVSVNLSAADEKSFLDWLKHNEPRVLDNLLAVVGDAYKLSLSYDFENECFIAALSGTKHSAQNAGCTITARSAEMVEALNLLLFKHLVMCEGGDWQEHTRPANWG